MGKGFISILTLGLFLMVSANVAAFGFQDVVALAQKRAQHPYSPPAKIPAFLQKLKFDQYQGIRFKPNKSLWRGTGSLFQVMLVSPGLYYQSPVDINVVDETGVHALAYQKSDFQFADPKIENIVPADLGYAGFKLTYPFHDRNTQNQFLVFAGASYFRGVGKDNAFGLSARGLAVDTGLSSGEEFPSFVDYWLVHPRAGARTMTFYALLDSKSVAGAYEFHVVPGAVTQLQVKAVLFPRNDIKMLGVAPLTSMFYYGANTPRPLGEWRPQVHDSDGLLIHNGDTGEWLWRTLFDPKQLQMDSFDTKNVQGFGLLQRQTHFREYQDLGALYEARPSAWIAPQGDWGKGKIVLVELPAANETDDNIVAFWTPDAPVKAGKSMSFAYTLGFGSPGLEGEPMGSAQATFVGDGNIVGGGQSKEAYRIVVDFSGPTLRALPPNAPVTGVVTAQNGGTVVEQFVQYAKPLRQWRLSMLVKPAAGKALEVRAYLRKGNQALTETWVYELPAKDQFKAGGQ